MIRVVFWLLLVAVSAQAAEKRSGYLDEAPATRAMQDDDSANPGFLWVQGGEAAWAAKAGTQQRSCAECHGAVAAMRGVAARYPAYDATLGRPLTVEQRINHCRQTHQGAPALAAESDELLGLAALIGLQSRGMKVQVATDGPARPFFAAGERFYTMRQGQLNLSCSQCHDGLAGHHLAGALVPQGHANGYPLYRLEWQAMGSLARRIRNCLFGVRAAPLDPTGEEFAALALYLAWRDEGLAVETPAVRP